MISRWFIHIFLLASNQHGSKLYFCQFYAPRFFYSTPVLWPRGNDPRHGLQLSSSADTPQGNYWPARSIWHVKQPVNQQISCHSGFTVRWRTYTSPRRLWRIQWKQWSSFCPRSDSSFRNKKSLQKDTTEFHDLSLHTMPLIPVRWDSSFPSMELT